MSINSTQIKIIFDQIELDDLKRDIKEIRCLNSCNWYLMYLFHFIQLAGILITTIGTAKNFDLLIWFGIGLNILASLINIYEKLNNNILKKLLIDIDKIKKGVYSVESQLIDIENNDGNLPTTSSTLKYPNKFNIILYLILYLFNAYRPL